MNLAKPPPTVIVGPWRNPEAVAPPASTSKKPSEFLGWVWDIASGIIDLGDLVEFLFGFFRILGHLIVVAIHAILHL